MEGDRTMQSIIRSMTTSRAATAMILALSLLSPLGGSAKSREAWSSKDLFGVYEREMYQVRKKIPANFSKRESSAAIAKEVEALNTRTINELRTYKPEVGQGSVRPEFITREQAQNVLRTIDRHPVIGSYSHMQYDPDLSMGFCFGRATYVHLDLLRRGVNKDSIAKLFALGTMKTGQTEWRYHVTTIVKGPGNTWWAIDNFVNRMITAEQWMQEMQRYDKDPANPHLRFYFVEAKRFGPDVGQYTPDELSHPDYRNYFVDLMQWLKNNPVQPQDSFKKQN
jgi:hypothetical protein